jgi:hypothetical protein
MVRRARNKGRPAKAKQGVEPQTTHRRQRRGSQYPKNEQGIPSCTIGAVGATPTFGRRVGDTRPSKRSRHVFAPPFHAEWGSADAEDGFRIHWRGGEGVIVFAFRSYTGGETQASKVPEMSVVHLLHLTRRAMTLYHGCPTR